jgi:hypothetical protein
MKSSFWTPHRDRKLRKIWGRRKGSEIATELGTTPNAVIGRIHRILGTYQREDWGRQGETDSGASHKQVWIAALCLPESMP